MVKDMEQNGSTKFYLRLSFYTIIGMFIYIGLVLYLFNNNMMLRNKANIFLSIILIILVGFSLFQNIIIKNKNNNIKLAICLMILIIVFGITAYSNNIIINKYLEKETIEKYKGEKYITYKLNNETYYYKIYSDYLRSKQALFSVSRKEIKEEGYTYVIDTITVFDDKGQIVEVKTEGDTKVVS